jgi:hypothetical protein
LMMTMCWLTKAAYRTLSSEVSGDARARRRYSCRRALCNGWDKDYDPC